MRFNPQGVCLVPAATELEKTYLSAAGGYLHSQNEEGMKVATAMAGLSSGAITLGQLRQVISDAHFITNAAFQGDYLKSGRLAVPQVFASVDKKIRNSHSLRVAAFEEYLAYWKDSNSAHVVPIGPSNGLSRLLRKQRQN